MQRQFLHSKVFRRLCEACAWLCGSSYRGNKRYWQKICRQAFCGVPEAQIKAVLYNFLQCYDITGEERAEALRLLGVSQTLLTAEQKERLRRQLEE